MLDKNNNDAIEAEELAGFICELLRIKCRVLNTTVDTLAGALKGQLVNAVVAQIFTMFALGGDRVKKEEIEQMAVSWLELLNSSLQAAAEDDEDDMVNLLKDDVKAMNKLAEEAAEGGCDYDKFRDFLKGTVGNRIDFLASLIAKEEVTDMIPESIMEQINELVPCVVEALKAGLENDQMD